MTQLLLVLVFGFLFYLFNELEDESSKSTWKKHKTFLNTNKSWRNKWALNSKNNVIPAIKKWYYFGVTPHYKERFLYSSTLLVFLTDGEHLFQFIKFKMLDLAFLIIDWKFFVAFEIGKSMSSFIKEKFLKNIN